MSFKPCAWPQAPKIFFRAAYRSWPIDIVWPKTDFVKQIPSCGWIKYSDCQHDVCTTTFLVCLLTRMETWSDHFLQAFSSFLWKLSIDNCNKILKCEFWPSTLHQLSWFQHTCIRTVCVMPELLDSTHHGTCASMVFSTSSRLNVFEHLVF